MSGNVPTPTPPNPPGPTSAPSPSSQISSAWYVRWRGFIRAAETTFVGGFVLAALTMTDFEISALLLFVGGVVGVISLCAEPARPVKRKLIFSATLLISFLIIGGWIFNHTHKQEQAQPSASIVAQSPPDEVLPGFSFSAVFSMSDIAELSRQYVFEYTTPEGAKVAFYLSASDRFTFSVTDRNGESYPVAVPLGKYGIPIDRPIVLYCDVGSGSNYAFMRVFMDNKQILRQDYLFPIDMGSRQWIDGTLGANKGFSNGSSFQISEIIFEPKTRSKADLQILTENEMNAYHITDLPALPPPTPEPQ